MNAPPSVTEAGERARLIAASPEGKRESRPGGREYRERRDLFNRWCAVQGDGLSEPQEDNFLTDLAATTNMTKVYGPLEAGVGQVAARVAQAMFDGGGRFASLYQNGAEDALVRNTNVPTWLRAFHAGVARAHEDGHAPFAVGELAEVIGVRRDVARAAVVRAVTEGVLSPTSDVQCLVLPMALHRPGSGRRGAAGCHHRSRADYAPSIEQRHL